MRCLRRETCWRLSAEPCLLGRVATGATQDPTGSGRCLKSPPPYPALHTEAVSFGILNLETTDPETSVKSFDSFMFYYFSEGIKSSTVNSIVMLNLESIIFFILALDEDIKEKTKYNTIITQFKV